MHCIPLIANQGLEREGKRQFIPIKKDAAKRVKYKIIITKNLIKSWYFTKMRFKRRENSAYIQRKLNKV